MCEFSEKLVAWIDGELSSEEAAEVQRHLGGCPECRDRAHAYKHVSAEFDAYCDEMTASSVKRRANPWTAVTAAAGAVASLVALCFVWPSAPVQPPAFHVSQKEAAVAAFPVVAEHTPPLPVHPIRKLSRREVDRPVQVRSEGVTRVQSQVAYSVPEGPVIQISIPADEVFPPGAVPQGMGFVADVTLAADGSAESMSLRPRLVGFERRTGQP